MPDGSYACPLSCRLIALNIWFADMIFDVAEHNLADCWTSLSISSSVRSRKRSAGRSRPKKNPQ